MANQNVFVANLVGAAASTFSPDLDNFSGQGAHVIIDVTAITGTVPMLTVTVEGKDPLSGKYYPILVSAAITAVSTTVLRIYPDATAAANVAANDFIPRNFRVSMAIAGTTPAVTARIAMNING